MTDWEQIIQQLKEQQKLLKPGDGKILDIESIIQAIRSDALEGNYGHARFFASHPGTKEGALKRINSLVTKFLPSKEK